MTAADRCFSVAKLFFAYGLGNSLYFPLAVGGTSILSSGPPKPELVFETVKRHRPTLFFSVPSNVASLLAYAEHCQDFDLSSVRHAVSAGEALPAAIFHRFKQRFRVEILDAIGSTEALHMFIANRPGAARPGSSGQIIEGYEAKIVDEENNPVPDGEIGNLLIRSDAVCSALQLVNFWQDLSVDLPRGRRYLPREDCRVHGLADADFDRFAPLAATTPPSAAIALVASEVAWARGLMQEGAPLVHRLPGRAGWELRFVVQGGSRILDKIEAQGCDSFSARPTLVRGDAALLAWRALRMRRQSAA